MANTTALCELARTNLLRNVRSLLRLFTLLLAFLHIGSRAEAAAVCEQVRGLSCSVQPPMAVYTPLNPSESASADWFKRHGLQAAPWKRSVALLVGVSDYDNHEKLQFVKKNVQEL